MTATHEEPAVGPPAEASSRPPDARRRAVPSVRDGCPFLVGVDGGWRGIAPTKDHRCGATLPMAAPAAVKQRDICLADAHRACATYVAARNLELESAAGTHPDSDSGFWPATRSTVLALEPARPRMSLLPGVSGRHGGQALLVGLMVVAFLVVVIARTTPPTGGGSTSNGGGLAASGAPASASAAPGASAVPSPAASAATGSPAPSAAPTSSAPPASATPGATAKPKPTAVPANATRYKVKSGDTLSSIASRYRTTVKKLKAANGLKSNVIHVGQVLIIP